MTPPEPETPVPEPTPVVTPPVPEPTPAPVVPAPAPIPSGDGHYKTRWAVNIGIMVFLILIDGPTLAQKVGWASLGISDIVANWILVVSGLAGVVSNLWFPNVFARPTPMRLLAENAARGNETAALRLHNLVRAQYRITAD